MVPVEPEELEGADYEPTPLDGDPLGAFVGLKNAMLILLAMGLVLVAIWRWLR